MVVASKVTAVLDDTAATVVVTAVATIVAAWHAKSLIQWLL
jgi:hypothetical protein